MENEPSNGNRVSAIFDMLDGPAVLIEVANGKKIPVDKGWTQFTKAVMEDPVYIDRLNNGGNIGVSLGLNSDGLCSIDIDEDELIEEFLKLNPKLRMTLRTKRLDGCNFWIWVTGDYPSWKPLHHARMKKNGKPKQIGEWRSTGSQTVIAGQAEGIPYKRVITGKPIRIAFHEIVWPEWIADPPMLDLPSSLPKSGHNLDLAKLDNVVSHSDGSVHAACPACRENNEDESGNHLFIRTDGRFGCCKYVNDKEHRRLIWKLAGIPKSPSNGDPFNDFQDSKPPPEKFTILTFSQILELERDENDRILGDHLLDKGSPLVIAGQGGTGKSRLLIQFIAFLKMQFKKFLNFDIHPGTENLRWLIIQSENSPWRLQDEAKKYQKSMSEDAWANFNSSVFILCPTKEHDSMLNLNDEENVARIKLALDDFKPDCVVADPLGEFSTGNLDKDVDMKSTVIALSRTIRHGNPKRSIIIAHHALTGQAGAAKAVGYDRSSFARNSKVLFNWTRAQINVAPMNPDNNDQLSISCGKCSDGREFSPFAVRLNSDSMLYECDQDVNVASWAKSVNLSGRPTIHHESDVWHLLDDSPKTTAEWQKLAYSEFNTPRSSFYEIKKSLLSQRKILRSAINRKWTQILINQTSDKSDK